LILFVKIYKGLKECGYVFPKEVSQKIVGSAKNLEIPFTTSFIGGKFDVFIILRFS
jgi:hypothetical protein